MTSFSTVKITHLTTVIGRRKVSSSEPHGVHHIGDTIDEPIDVDHAWPEVVVDRPTEPIKRKR